MIKMTTKNLNSFFCFIPIFLSQVIQTYVFLKYMVHVNELSILTDTYNSVLKALGALNTLQFLANRVNYMPDEFNLMSAISQNLNELLCEKVVKTVPTTVMQVNGLICWLTKNMNFNG